MKSASQKRTNVAWFRSCEGPRIVELVGRKVEGSDSRAVGGENGELLSNGGRVSVSEDGQALATAAQQCECTYSL